MTSDTPNRREPVARTSAADDTAAYRADDTAAARANDTAAYRADDTAAYRADDSTPYRADDSTARTDDASAHRADYSAVPQTRGTAHGDRSLHDEVLHREKERFGGMKFGSAFFGWLTAMGLAVLLTALIAAIGGAIGLTDPETAEDAANAAAENMGVATIIGAIALGLVLFVSYFAGGYVAGRMARFDGMKQGLAVWLWAIAIAVAVAVITAIAGSQWDILASLNGFPRIPVSAETATTTGILTAVGAAIVTLVGALLGGAAGMRYHRRVDREGLGAPARRAA
jgi:hypothetical protein